MVSWWFPDVCSLKTSQPIDSKSWWESASPLRGVDAWGGPMCNKIGTTLWQANLAMVNSEKKVVLMVFSPMCSWFSHLKLHLLKACPTAVLDYRRISLSEALGMKLTKLGWWIPATGLGRYAAQLPSAVARVWVWVKSIQKRQLNTRKIGLVRCGQMLNMPGNA